MIVRAVEKSIALFLSLKYNFSARVFQRVKAGQTDIHSKYANSQTDMHSKYTYWENEHAG